MKVTSGLYRSRKLKSPQGRAVRPTSEIVKQALFNMLAPTVRGARVLELFCGTGQLGIEALSNGAESVVFVDSARESAALTRENLHALGLEAEVLQLPFEQAVAVLERRGARFDLILADPPYAGGFYEQLQALAAQSGVLRPGGVLVMEFDTNLPPQFSAAFTVLRQKSYGRRSLVLLQKKEESDETNHLSREL